MKRLIGFMICMLCFYELTYAQSEKGQIKIVDNYSQITTIPQLLSPFKGKPVFVDLWATWCEPCKDEFKYSNELYQGLNKRGIQMLYVSLYQNVIDTEWRSDIVKFQLQGNHILSNKTLQDAFTTLIWGGVDAFSIPHYLLFDANGKLLLKDALPPSSRRQLIDEIDKTLSKQ